MEEIRKIFRTTIAKVASAIVTGIIALLAYITDGGTDWSTFIQEEESIEETP